MVLTDTSKGKLYTDNTVESLFLATSVSAKFAIVQAKPNSLSSVKHCNCTFDISNLPIIQTKFCFSSRDSKNQDSTVQNCTTILLWCLTVISLHITLLHCKLNLLKMVLKVCVSSNQS